MNKAINKLSFLKIAVAALCVAAVFLFFGIQATTGVTGLDLFFNDGAFDYLDFIYIYGAVALAAVLAIVLFVVYYLRPNKLAPFIWDVIIFLLLSWALMVMLDLYIEEFGFDGISGCAASSITLIAVAWVTTIVAAVSEMVAFVGHHHHPDDVAAVEEVSK
ncbi:MAG: hypothetical protein LUC31_03280 [Coprobacillus sp.]|nr:hypothetical protein [Coprobacillus sp.]